MFDAPFPPRLERSRTNGDRRRAPPRPGAAPATTPTAAPRTASAAAARTPLRSPRPRRRASGSTIRPRVGQTTSNGSNKRQTRAKKTLGPGVDVVCRFGGSCDAGGRAAIGGRAAVRCLDIRAHRAVREPRLDGLANRLR